MSMFRRLASSFLWMGCMAGPASATANLGGIVTALSGSGQCSDTHSVPGTTAQDSFALSAATACAGGSAGGAVHADAVTGTGGLSGHATGSSAIAGSSQVAAQLQYMDQWRIDVPAGTAIGKISIPVVLTIEGFVAPGSISGFNRYFDYALAVRDLYSAPIPDPPFNAIFGTYGSVTATGTFQETVTGFVNFNYYGPGAALPTMAEVTMTLGMPGLQEGLVDFGHTASIALVLPPGYSAYTSSGLLLDFAPPVPEPGSLSMLLAGAGVVALAAWRRRLPIRAAN